MKVLALDIDNLSLDMAIDFMRCFPSLEKLYIRVISLHLAFLMISKDEPRFRLAEI